MLLAIAPLTEDKRFRRVTGPGVFTAVAGTVPVLGRWLPVMDPISGIYPMGGLHNSMRRLAVDGVPVATGLAAVGDSVCTTNPTFGRALRAAMPFDAIVFRAFWRVMGMLANPGDVYTDPGIVARTQDVLRSLGTASATTQPTRAQLEAALAWSAGSGLTEAGREGA
jgi:hypothetical protein